MASVLRALTKESINPRVLAAKYAVRGELVLKAMEYEKQITAAKEQGKPSPFQFEKLVYCNIGNPQSLKQKPITFFRQVLALCDVPELMESPEASKIFPSDAIQRAKKILSGIKGGTGAYSESQGILVSRQDVAQFIQQRDGHPASPDDIFLSEGASQGIATIINMLTRNEKDAIMIPTPQYPLYSATLALVGAASSSYHLDETQNWGLSLESLNAAVAASRSRKEQVRALVVINPGNPSGACLSRDNMEQIVRFCEQHNLVLLADEVYQTNCYNSAIPFVSFKKVVRDLGSTMQLFSFHSVSKGVIGECGRRGGYLEVTNVEDDVKQEIYKLFSIGLCSNVPGQITVGLMCNPPKPGDVSYPLYKQEVDAIYDSLKRRAALLSAALNQMENVSCTSIDGAMYAFPRIRLPEKAIAEAEKNGKAPDVFYALELLKNTGICVVPGSGFGQEEGTWHVRTTFLPPETEIKESIERFKAFNSEFMRKFA